MLATYIDQAMELARYEIIEDEGTYWGEIPGLQGVWALACAAGGRGRRRWRVVDANCVRR